MPDPTLASERDLSYMTSSCSSLQKSVKKAKDVKENEEVQPQWQQCGLVSSPVLGLFQGDSVPAECQRSSYVGEDEEWEWGRGQQTKAQRYTVW